MNKSIPQADLDSALIECAEKGMTVACRALVQAGANVDCTSNNVGGSTPLHRAAMGGHTETCRALIEMGANIDTRLFAAELTPLQVAAINARKEVCYLLIAMGAKKEIDPKRPYMDMKVGGVDMMQMTPAKAAIRLNDPELLHQVMDRLDQPLEIKDLEELASFAKASKKPEMVNLLRSMSARAKVSSVLQKKIQPGLD